LQVNDIKNTDSAVISKTTRQKTALTVALEKTHNSTEHIEHTKIL